MPDVVRTDRAELDLIEILVHLGERSEKAANRFAAALDKACAVHAQFPTLGVACDELSRGLRRFTVEKYAIFFRSIQDGIEIIRVVHGARDFPSLFQDQPPTSTADPAGDEDQ